MNLDATNPNLILPMKFNSSSLELSTLQTHIIVYRLGCRSRIPIRTFFQIWICSIQIHFIAIFRFERFYTIHIPKFRDRSGQTLKSAVTQILVPVRAGLDFLKCTWSQRLGRVLGSRFWSGDLCPDLDEAKFRATKSKLASFEKYSS